MRRREFLSQACLFAAIVAANSWLPACVLLKDVFDYSLEEIAQLVDSTVQFYESDNGSWRIKTYATDQDVHVWSLGKNVEDIVSLARSNTAKHYGDVLSE
jgi:hypothetical protein